MNRFPSILHASALLAIFAGCVYENTAFLSDSEKRERIESMYQTYKADDFPGVTDISAAELASWLDDGDVVVVDVREAEERAVSTLPGAITRDEFEKRLDTLGDKRVVAYCTIGYRSGVFSEEMSKKGITVHNLKGSILAWTHTGEPVLDPDGTETKRVHVYGAQWNLLPEEYKAEW